MVNAAGQKRLPKESVKFRVFLVTALWDDRRFGYVDEDRFIGSCPICASALGVRFTGTAPQASLNCYGDCAEAEIAERLGLQVRS